MTPGQPLHLQMLWLNEKHNNSNNPFQDCPKTYCCWSSLRIQLYCGSLDCDYRHDSLCGFYTVFNSFRGQVLACGQRQRWQVNITYWNRGTDFSLTCLNPNGFLNSRVPLKMSNKMCFGNKSSIVFNVAFSPKAKPDGIMGAETLPTLTPSRSACRGWGRWGPCVKTTSLFRVWHRI